LYLQESHLQEAIIAQQACTSGIAIENHVIPTPKVFLVGRLCYDSIYPVQPPPSNNHLIKVQASLTIEKDQPEYDIDSEDEIWLSDHRSSISINDFEKMMELLEGASSDLQICQPSEARALLKDFDDDLIDDVYDYWLQKRKDVAAQRNVASLIPKIKTDSRRDSLGSSNPYVAFRRRAEKMQTRKNRKNDEDSYEKIMKLGHDLCKALVIFNMIKKRLVQILFFSLTYFLREQAKTALVNLDEAVANARSSIDDMNGSYYNQIVAKLKAEQNLQNAAEKETDSSSLSEISKSTSSPVRSKNKKCRKYLNANLPKDDEIVSRAWLKRNIELWNRPPLVISGVGATCFQLPGSKVGVDRNAATSSDSAADGRYAFKRRRGCMYRESLPSWISRKYAHNRRTGSERALHNDLVEHTGSDRSRTSLSGIYKKSAKIVQDLSLNFYQTSLPLSIFGGIQRIGYARRRLGRGGRIIYDHVVDPCPSTSQCTADELLYADYAGILNNSRSYQPAVVETINDDMETSTDSDDNERVDPQSSSVIRSSLQNCFSHEKLPSSFEQKTRNDRIVQNQMYNQELRLTTDNDVQSSMLGTYRKANGFYANTRNSLSSVNGSLTSSVDSYQLVNNTETVLTTPANGQLVVTACSLTGGTVFQSPSSFVPIATSTHVIPSQQSGPQALSSSRRVNYLENRVLDSSMLTNRFPVTNPYGSSNQESVAYSLPRSSEAMYVSKNIETPQTPYNPAFRTTLPAHRSPVDAIAKRMEHVELSQQQQQSSMGPSQENVYICRPADRSLVNGAKRQKVSNCIPQLTISKVMDAKTNGDSLLTLGSYDTKRLELAIVGSGTRIKPPPSFASTLQQTTVLPSVSSSLANLPEKTPQLSHLLKVSVSKMRNGVTVPTFSTSRTTPGNVTEYHSSIISAPISSNSHFDINNAKTMQPIAVGDLDMPVTTISTIAKTASVVTHVTPIRSEAKLLNALPVNVISSPLTLTTTTPTTTVRCSYDCATTAVSKSSIQQYMVAAPVPRTTSMSAIQQRVNSDIRTCRKAAASAPLSVIEATSNNGGDNGGNNIHINNNEGLLNQYSKTNEDEKQCLADGYCYTASR
uniref:Enhancer of polycomb-like protein n=1 Tax=Dracunculus medinensis TaxID=318479 RepID=A0A0N4U1Z6_DRAME